MDLLTNLLFILGFPTLIFGAHYLVLGASSVARKLGISDLVVGLTVVALGTSAPELIVSLLSAWHGVADLAIGNVVGSNISNILLIVGVAAVIYPLKIKENTRWKEIPFLLLSTLALAFLANDSMISGHNFSELDRGDGLVLLLFFAIFMYYIFSLAKNSRDAGVEKTKIYSNARASVMIVGGAVGLACGGQWIVAGATALAAHFGMSEALIGLTIVSIGTSLPELATSALAALCKNSDMAVGNIVGSNIMNIFWILGATATVTPVSFNSALNADILFLILITTLFFTFTFIWKKHCITKREGIIFLILYAGYIGFIVVRG